MVPLPRGPLISKLKIRIIPIITQFVMLDKIINDLLPRGITTVVKDKAVKIKEIFFLIFFWSNFFFGTLSPS